MELWAQDDWCLVLFADHGRFHLGIVHQEEKAFFLQNLSVPESDRQVDLAWNTVPEDEVVANKDLVRTCLLDFFHTARPSKAATWRELVMEG